MAGNTMENVTDEIVWAVLYGRWSRWGGQPPPPKDEESAIQTVPEAIKKTLPDNMIFGISTISENQIGIFVTRPIGERVRIGTYPGTIYTKINDLCHHDSIWEIFSEGVMKYIQASSPDIPNYWMTYMQRARHEQEQNVETLFSGENLFYQTIKNIYPGQEMLVWYGSSMPQYMGIPAAPTALEPKKKNLGYNEELLLPSASPMKCVVCQRGFNSRSNLRSHMRIHTQQRPFVCKFCQRSFSQSSTLRNHIRLHTGERPYKCQACNSAYSQLAGLRAHQKSARHRPA